MIPAHYLTLCSLKPLSEHSFFSFLCACLWRSEPINPEFTNKTENTCWFLYLNSGMHGEGLYLIMILICSNVKWLSHSGAMCLWLVSLFLNAYGSVLLQAWQIACHGFWTLPMRRWMSGDVLLCFDGSDTHFTLLLLPIWVSCEFLKFLACEFSVHQLTL